MNQAAKIALLGFLYDKCAFSIFPKEIIGLILDYFKIKIVNTFSVVDSSDEVGDCKHLVHGPNTLYSVRGCMSTAFATHVRDEIIAWEIKIDLSNHCSGHLRIGLVDSTMSEERATAILSMF